jgi:transcriptional regulator with XRE-family HTH domain
MYNLNPDYLNVISTLKMIRIIARYRLQDVEDMSNGEFTVAALGSYERNHRPLTLERLLKLCNIYGVSVETVIRHSMYGDQMHVLLRRKDELRTTA